MFHFAEDNKLCDLLVFATGLDAIPPLGIEPSPTLVFDHPANDHSRGVPFANTCANCLHVPVLADYELFKEMMMLALEVGVSFTNAWEGHVNSWTYYLSPDESVYVMYVGYLLRTVGWPKPATYQDVCKATMLVPLLCLMVRMDFLLPSQQSKIGEQGTGLLFIL